MRKVLFSCILVFLLYAFFECMSAGALFFLARFRDIHFTPTDRLSADQVATIESFIDDSASYFMFDREIGWTIRAHGRFKDLYQANGTGIRADREYAYKKPDGVLRICSFGDSFTHCDDVGNDATWQSFMESSRPGLEALNFGVGAYGLDQAYLRYRNKGRLYETDFVLVGFMPENIFRTVNTFRAFYLPDTGLPLAKPRFLLKQDGIVLLPNPLASLSAYRELLDNTAAKTSEIGEHDFFYCRRYSSGPLDFLFGVRLSKMVMEQARTVLFNQSPMKNGSFNQASEAFEITTRVFDLFYRACQEQAKPVILLFPHKGNMQQFLRNGHKDYAPLLEYFESKGYRYIDLMGAFEPALRQGKLDAMFAGEHYSADANKIVAAYVLSFIGVRIPPKGAGSE